MTGTSVRPAVTLMYVGAAITMARLIFGVVLLSIDFDGGGGGTMLGRSVTTSPNRGGVILGWSVFGLVSVALWLWMARANGRGRRWARVMSTVLFGLATLTLANGLLPGSPAGDGAAMVLLYYGGGAMLAAEWLTGLAAVWLLWRPDSSAFFQSVPLPPDSPVRSYARWSFAWAVSLALLGLSYLLFRVVRGLILLGYPWWWWLIAVVIVGPARWLLSLLSTLLRPGWPPQRRDGQPPQGDRAAAQQEGGDDPAVPAAQQEGGDTPVSK